MKKVMSGLIILLVFANCLLPGQTTFSLTDKSQSANLNWPEGNKFIIINCEHKPKTKCGEMPITIEGVITTSYGVSKDWEAEGCDPKTGTRTGIIKMRIQKGMTWPLIVTMHVDDKHSVKLTFPAPPDLQELFPIDPESVKVKDPVSPFELESTDIKAQNLGTVDCKTGHIQRIVPVPVQFNMPGKVKLSLVDTDTNIINLSNKEFEAKGENVLSLPFDIAVSQSTEATCTLELNGRKTKIKFEWECKKDLIPRDTSTLTIALKADMIQKMLVPENPQLLSNCLDDQIAEEIISFKKKGADIQLTISIDDPTKPLDLQPAFILKGTGTRDYRLKLEYKGLGGQKLPSIDIPSKLWMDWDTTSGNFICKLNKPLPQDAQLKFQAPHKGTKLEVSNDRKTVQLTCPNPVLAEDWLAVANCSWMSAKEIILKVKKPGSVSIEADTTGGIIPLEPVEVSKGRNIHLILSGDWKVYDSLIATIRNETNSLWTGTFRIEPLGEIGMAIVNIPEGGTIGMEEDQFCHIVYSVVSGNGEVKPLDFYQTLFLKGEEPRPVISWILGAVCLCLGIVCVILSVNKLKKSVFFSKKQETDNLDKESEGDREDFFLTQLLFLLTGQQEHVDEPSQLLAAVEKWVVKMPSLYKKQSGNWLDAGMHAAIALDNARSVQEKLMGLFRQKGWVGKMPSRNSSVGDQLLEILETLPTREVSVQPPVPLPLIDPVPLKDVVRESPPSSKNTILSLQVQSDEDVKTPIIQDEVIREFQVAKPIRREWCAEVKQFEKVLFETRSILFDWLERMPENALLRELPALMLHGEGEQKGIAWLWSIMKDEDKLTVLLRFDNVENMWDAPAEQYARRLVIPHFLPMLHPLVRLHHYCSTPLHSLRENMERQGIAYEEVKETMSRVSSLLSHDFDIHITSVSLFSDFFDPEKHRDGLSTRMELYFPHLYAALQARPSGILTDITAAGFVSERYNLHDLPFVIYK